MKIREGLAGRTYAMRRRDNDINQDMDELVGFLDLVCALGVRRYLEIGCRNGDSFFAVMSAIGPGGFGLAIDLSENDSTRGNLASTVVELGELGIDAVARFGNSQDPAIIGRADELSPFDLVLIDADHRYEGVKRDWENYHALAPVVALHDITAPYGHMSDEHPNGVQKFWCELREQYFRRTTEIVTPGSCMGFGIIHRSSQ